MGGDGGGDGSALKDIMSGTVAGIAQVIVGERQQKSCSTTRRPAEKAQSHVVHVHGVEVPQKMHMPPFGGGNQTRSTGWPWDGITGLFLWVNCYWTFDDEPGRAYVALSSSFLFCSPYPKLQRYRHVTGRSRYCTRGVLSHL